MAAAAAAFAAAAAYGYGGYGGYGGGYVPRGRGRGAYRGYVMFCLCFESGCSVNKRKLNLCFALYIVD